MGFLYYILTGGLMLLASPFIFLRALVSPSFRNQIKERMAGARSLPELKGTLWVHASSIGEVRLAKTLIAGLLKDGESRPIALSTFTPTGYALAKEENLPNVFRLPLDFSIWLNPVFEKIQPSKLVLIEAELWPCLLGQCKSRNVPVVQVNGRVSEKSVQRYGKFPPFFLWMAKSIKQFSMRSQTDADRLLQLGVAKDKVVVTGNIKFDVTSIQIEDQQEWKTDGMILVFGSTRPGEEGPIMEALLKLQKEFPGLIGVIAPRHMERCREVEDLIREFKVEYTLLSQLNDLSNWTGTLLLVDKLGKLNSLYSKATVAYVGGGFNPRFGGHNILEPAGLGKPVLFGHYMNNFEEEAKLLTQSGGGIQMQSEEELYPHLHRLLKDSTERQKLGQSAEKTVKANSGALRQNIELIRST
ncbi:MAG: 3-deoxy-D-manno-octulosonic acid transferase [Nitrospina sp.]|jgi:3-deoxy-D-manno-octulosonic-acid transferase|nr:3-deoxy-D-manno-octulosonic acid transferase [Nitrospina sp.]MBT5631459.1 3-deoxy-D-manno-octulosonic acid transferase [Nitrospina sp.]